MKALKKVVDPELGIDLVNLGLVYDVRINNGLVEIDMTLTSPGCPIAPQIMSESQEVVKKLKGVKKVQVEFVFDPPWTPKMISDEAKALLGI